MQANRERQTYRQPDRQTNTDRQRRKEKIDRYAERHISTGHAERDIQIKYTDTEGYRDWQRNAEREKGTSIQTQRDKETQ